MTIPRCYLHEDAYVENRCIRPLQPFVEFMISLLAVADHFRKSLQILQLVVENGMLDPTTVIACIGTNNECRSTILVRLSVLRHVPLPFSLNSVTKLNRRTFDHLFPFTAVDGAGLLFYYHPRPRWGCLAKDARREREVEEEENDAGGSERGDNTGSGGEGDESGANENYGSRTAHQRDYLAGEEKVLLKLFNEVSWISITPHIIQPSMS